MIEVICQGCGIPFQAKESLIKIGKGKFHSSSCANKFHSGKNIVEINGNKELIIKEAEKEMRGCFAVLSY